MLRRLLNRFPIRAALILLLAACASLAPSPAGAEAAEDWTINGEVYKNIIVTTVSPASVVIRHSRGLISLPLHQLPAELQKRFNYDPAAETAFREAQEQKEKAAREQRAAKKKAIEARASKPTPVPRDRLNQALQQLGQPAALAESVDLRPKFLEFGLAPRDQGQRPSCAIFAVTSALEYALARSGKREALSEEYLIWATARYVGQPPVLTGSNTDEKAPPRDLGFTLASVVQGAHRFGLAHKEDVPNALYGSVRQIEAPSDEVIANARQRPAILAVDLTGKNQADKIAPILTMLNNGWPVVVGLRWPSAATMRERPFLHGQTPLPKYGHAVTIVGYYAEAKDPERLVFVFRNSWGITWGIAGHGFVSRDYLSKNLMTAMVLDVTD